MQQNITIYNINKRIAAWVYLDSTSGMSLSI